MKKLFCLVAMLLLSACGGGGGGVSTTTVDSTTPTGTLAVKIASPTDSTGKTLSSIAAGKNYRVVVRNQALRVNGAVFSAIQDATPGGTLTFALPVATGYSVEAVAYNNDPTTGLNSVLHYAIATGVRVDTSGTSEALLALHPVTANLVLPASVQQGGRYTVMANLSTSGGRQVTPLQTTWYLSPPRTTTFVPFTNDTSATSFTTSHIYQAPLITVVPTNLFFQAVFTVKPTLLGPGESQKSWIFNSPEYSIPVTAPVNLTITAPNF